MRPEDAPGGIGIRSAYARVGEAGVADAVNRRDLDALPSTGSSCRTSWTSGTDPDDPPGAERFKRSFRSLIAACPDLHISVEQQLIERADFLFNLPAVATARCTTLRGMGRPPGRDRRGAQLGLASRDCPPVAGNRRV